MTRGEKEAFTANATNTPDSVAIGNRAAMGGRKR